MFRQRSIDLTLKKNSREHLQTKFVDINLNLIGQYKVNFKLRMSNMNFLAISLISADID